MGALALLVVLVVVGGPILVVIGLISARRRLADVERRLDSDHSRRLLDLEDQVREMREARKAEQTPVSPPAPVHRAPSPERPRISQPASPPAAPPPEQIPESPAGAPTSPPPSAQAPHPPQPQVQVPFSDWLSEAKAWLLGGNTVVRVGMIVVLFGVSFFLKFAFDQGWVPIEIRLMSAAMGGLGLTGLGWWLRESRREFALVIQGGGVGIVYLTVFASANFYDLIGTGAATVLMVVLVALASALAVLQNARSLAVLATIGGFLAPVLVSSGGSHVALFGYYLVLDLGILGIAWFRAWRVLNLLGFIFTFGIGSAWGSQYYQPEFFASTEPFLIAFFLLYVAVPVLFSERTGTREGSEKPGRGLVDGSLVFGTPLIAFGLQHALLRDSEYGLAISAVAAGLLYVTLGTLLWRRGSELFSLLVEIFVSLAVVFGTLAIPLALDARWTGAAWALEGAGLVWVGVRQRQLLALLSGLVMQVAAAGAFFVALALFETPEIPIANGIFLGAVLVSLAGLASAWHLRLDRRDFAIATLGWGLVWWFGAGLNEIATFVPETDRFHADLLFVASSLALAGALRSHLAWRMLAFPLLALLPVMMALSLGLFSTQEHAFTATGLVVWAAAFTAHLWLLARVDAHEDWPPLLTFAWHIGTLWLGVFLLSWETAWVMEQIGGTRPAWQMVAWILWPVATIAGVPAMVRRARLRQGLTWPLAAHADAYHSGLALPAILTVFWILVASFEPGDPLPLPYLPIANPIELVQVVALIVVVLWVSSTSESTPWMRELLGTSRVGSAVGVVGFVVLNGMIARATHMYGDVPFRFDSLWESASYQAVASITWTLAALIVMVTATRWKRRAAWGTGAMLLGLVVAKLFLVDLAGIGTVARIVSFLVVGTLILLIGYLSPLPPRSLENPS